MSTEYFHANENTLYDSIMMNTVVQTHRPYNTKSELPDKLWNVGHIICQCRFIPCTTLMEDVDDRGAMDVLEQGVYTESLPFSQFYCEH